jgi:hypothetical protein
MPERVCGAGRFPDLNKKTEPVGLSQSRHGIALTCRDTHVAPARSRANVADLASLKYRAFLSYSHRDVGWARSLHGWLESFRVDKDLVGRETALGPVPKTLRPIFRDREDFPADTR